MGSSEAARTILHSVEIDRSQKPKHGLIKPEVLRKKLPRLVRKAHEGGKPLSVIMLDLSYFKSVNDKFGHEAGTAILDEVSATVGLVTKQLRIQNRWRNLWRWRQSDLVTVQPISPPRGRTGLKSVDTLAARAGGDEYIIVGHTDEEGAKVIASRLRTSLDERFRRPDIAMVTQKTGFNSAIGFATLKPGMDASDLLGAADEATYQDKIDRIGFDLTPVQAEFLRDTFNSLDEYGLRIRDLGKYALALGFED